MPDTYVEYKATLRDDLRTNFPEFGTFLRVTPTVVLVPDGYSQTVYDWLAANCVIMPNPNPVVSAELIIGSVTAGTEDGQRAYSPAHQEWFEWKEDAGVAGEWWSRPKHVSWGSSGQTANGTPFRVVSSLTTSSNRGPSIPGRTRALSLTGKWGENESGRIDVRRNGISQFQVIVSNQQTYNEAFLITDANKLIETFNGSPVAGSADSNYLQFYWVNSSTGSIRRSQFTMRIVDVLIAGD